MKTKKLITAVELLKEEYIRLSKDERTKQIVPSSIYRDEISEIIPEFLDEIYAQASIAELEHRIELARKVDVASIKQAIDIIARYQPKSYELPIKDKQENEKDRRINTDKLINDINEGLDVIDRNQTQLGSLEVYLRLEMFFDSEFDRLTMAFEPSSRVYDDLKILVVKKMEKLEKDDVLVLWARLKALFRSDTADRGFVRYDDIIPPSYFEDANSIEVIRERYADFIVRLKPLTIKRMLTEGYTSHPLGPLGIARLLALPKEAGITRITNMDVLVIKSISKLVVLFEDITFNSKDELARTVRTEKDGLVFNGEYYQEFKKEIANQEKPILYEILILVMKRLVEYVDEISLERSNVSRALWQYKLGQEVIAPIRTKDIIKTREILLQKELSKYLIEREILSFGRTFGRNEIDLYSKEIGGEDYVIEVKVYKKEISETLIEANLVQLFSYMDQVSQPRGVLAIYNCTNDLIIAPRKWIKGRVWVLAINICPATPSKRKRSLEIVESVVQHKLIDCIVNGR